jgi:hypothetical protein
VSIQVKSVAGSRHRPAASAGPGAELALIAMPSIAAQVFGGDGHRARSGTAVTLPSPSRTGTCSATGSQRHPALVHAASHCA